MRATISYNYSAKYYEMTELYVQKWYQLGQIIENNDTNVADIVTLLPRLKSFNIRMNYPAQTVPRLFLSSLNMKFNFIFCAKKIVSLFPPPLLFRGSEINLFKSKIGLV